MGDLKTQTTSYPGSKDTATLIANGETGVNTHINGLLAAVIAIENELGIGLKGSLADLVARLAVNIHADGGLLRGTSFPTNPPNIPHYFYRSDGATLYIYNTTTAQYDTVTTAAILGDYLRKATSDTITAQHTFNPPSPQAPFLLGANAVNQQVVGLQAQKADSLLGNGAYRIADTNNTGDAIVRRDANGDFAARIITAGIIGNVQGNVTGSSGSCTGNSATATNATNAASATNSTNATNATNATGAGTAIYSDELGTKIIRGTMNSNGTVYVGNGWSVVRNFAGNYTITFTSNFSGYPSIVFTPVVSGNPGFVQIVTCTNISVNFQIFNTSMVASDGAVYFIAIGPK